MDKLLKLDPKERLTAKDALKHPFFTEQNFENQENKINFNNTSRNIYSSQNTKSGNSTIVI